MTDHRRALVGVAAAVAGLASVAGVAIWSPLLAVRSVEVTGASRLTRGQVLETAGIAEGTRSFLVDEADIETRLEANPWVARALVTTALPSTVHIQIRERKPVAAMGETGSYVLLAADGVALGRVEQRPPLPVVVAAPMQLGTDWASGPSKAIADIPAHTRREIERVIVRPGPQLELQLESGIVVEFGSIDAAEAKGEALAAILRWADRRGVRPAVIDVRAPGAPAIRMASGRGGSS